MKRSTFKPRVLQREARDPDRLRTMPTVTPGAFRAPQPVATTPVVQVPKDAPVRSEAYRRAVASLPCAICGVPGYSQAAHANQGKGMGMKACDMTCFPLCTVHPVADGTLVQGCHERFDQGALFSKLVRRDLEQAWIADTQRKIYSMGLWPENLPLKSQTN